MEGMKRNSGAAPIKADPERRSTKMQPRIGLQSKRKKKRDEANDIPR
jgi:hypothetical protein